MSTSSCSVDGKAAVRLAPAGVRSAGSGAPLLSKISCTLRLPRRPEPLAICVFVLKQRCSGPRGGQRLLRIWNMRTSAWRAAPGVAARAEPRLCSDGQSKALCPEAHNQAFSPPTWPGSLSAGMASLELVLMRELQYPWRSYAKAVERGRGGLGGQGSEAVDGARERSAAAGPLRESEKELRALSSAEQDRGPQHRPMGRTEVG